MCVVCVNYVIPVEGILHIPSFGFVMSWLVILDRITIMFLCRAGMAVSRRSTIGIVMPHGRPVIRCAGVRGRLSIS